jgi:ATP-grasp ribosomal peptide maturase
MAAGMVLVVTGIDDLTADLVIAELNRRDRLVPVRLDPGDFPHAVSLAGSLDIDSGRWRGALTTATREIDLAEVVAVYWRRPSPYRFDALSAADAEFAAAQARIGVAGVLASLRGVRYVNHPHRNWAAEFKPAQLAAAVELGFDVPATLITSDPAAARAFVAEQAPVVFKPLRITDLEHDGRPVALWAQRVASDELDETIAGTAHLFQAEVADKACDLRITVVGEQVFCVRIDSERLDWRSDYDALRYRVVDPGPGLVSRLRAYLDRFGLVFGCFDFAVDQGGTPYFLECNPNGQWSWLEGPTGLSMTAAFADALDGSQISFPALVEDAS